MRRTILASLLLSIAAACGPTRPYVWIHELPPAPGEQYRIQVGDRITVVVLNQTQVSGDFEVRPNGAYLQPLVGEIQVLGLTAAEAGAQVADRLDGIIVEPEVTLQVTLPHPLRINVLGEVRTPGQFDVPFGEGLIGALARAGGLTEFASEGSVFVLRKGPENRRIRFHYRELIGGDARSIDFKLRDGDVVVVE
ncbi:MAG: polysaccharide export protein [Deltaproteobacteria bacterium]|nr:polysaccharide export protein [Deltaproteobacteria bacterium]